MTPRRPRVGATLSATRAGKSALRIWKLATANATSVGKKKYPPRNSTSPAIATRANVMRRLRSGRRLAQNANAATATGSARYRITPGPLASSNDSSVVGHLLAGDGLSGGHRHALEGPGQRLAPVVHRNLGEEQHRNGRHDGEAQRNHHGQVTRAAVPPGAQEATKPLPPVVALAVVADPALVEAALGAA